MNEEDEKDYEKNRRSNRPEFVKREKFGTEFMDNLEESAVGRFFDLSGERQQVIDQASREGRLGKVSQFTQKIEDKVGQTIAPVLKPVGAALSKISDVTQIDERISTPLTFVAAGAAAKGISKIKPKHLGITQTIEPYTPPKSVGKVPRKMVNITQEVDDIMNMKPTRVQEIIKIAKKNKISYKKAQEYVDLKEQGIVPTQTINPGTNAGIIKAGEGTNDPTVYIPPEERIGTQKGDPLQMAEEPVDPGDIPDIDLSTMIDPVRGKNKPNKNILSILNQNGMRGGRVDVFAYRQAGKNRAAVEYYLSPYYKMIKFNPRRNQIAISMSRQYGGYLKNLGLGEKASFQAHHIVPIKAAFLGFHGIVKESPKYHYYMKLYHDNLLYTGNQLENIKAALGMVDRDRDSPHSLVHQFIEEVMGKSGELFWDDTTLESLVVRDADGKIIRTRNDEMRERLMLKQIELFKRGEDILNIAMKEYSLYAGATTVPPEVIVNYFSNNLPSDLKYTPKLIKKLVNDAMQDFAGAYVPSVVGGTVSQDTLRIIQEIMDLPPNEWALLNVEQKKAKLPELTESYRGAGDGYTFERLMELNDAGMLSDSMMDKLLAAEDLDFEGFLDELFPDE